MHPVLVVLFLLGRGHLGVVDHVRVLHVLLDSTLLHVYEVIVVVGGLDGGELLGVVELALGHSRLDHAIEHSVGGGSDLG